MRTNSSSAAGNRLAVINRKVNLKMFNFKSGVYQESVQRIFAFLLVLFLMPYSGDAPAQNATVSSPESIWITSSSESSLSVAWTPVNDNRLHSYNLTLNGFYAGWTEPGVNTYTFDNLQAGSTFELGVRSIEVPAKVYSSAVSVSGTTDSDVIPSPNEIWVAGSTATSVTIGWSPVIDNRLHSYNVAVNGAYAGWTSPGVTQYTFNGLLSDAEHVLGVRSVEVPAEKYSPLTTLVFTPENDVCNSPERYHVDFINGQVHSFVDATDTVQKLNGINVRSPVNGGSARYSQIEFNAIAAKGFDHIRLPLNWYEYETNEGVFESDRLATLDEVVARAESAGLGVILDPIHLKSDTSANYWGVPAWAWGALNPSQETVFDELKAHALPYLAMLTQRYCNNDSVIAIDLVNEPREPNRGNLADRNRELVAMYGDWIELLRSIDANKPFLLEPFYGGGRMEGLSLLPLSQYEQIIWSVHDYYAGGGQPSHGFSNWGLATVQPRTEYYLSADAYPTTNRVTSRADMQEHISVHKDNAALAGIPIHIGEYGIPKGWTGGWRFLCDKTDVYNQLEVPSTAWVWNADIDGHFGLWHPDSGWRYWVDAIFDSQCQ